MTMIYFLLAAAALGILVFFHELGHYWAAKKCGMTVEVFSIGFGKPLLKWRWNDVDWQLGWLPFGGYVKIAGMEMSKKDRQSYSEPYEIPNGFFSKPPWKRILVACAGPCANFILAFLLFSFLWVSGGREKPFSDFTQIIGWVDPQSEAFALGLRPGDKIVSYNGKPYKGSKDLLYAAMLSGKEVDLHGYHIDYVTGSKTPFNYTVETYPAQNSLDGILTTGIVSNARYLIYDRYPGDETNPLPEGSPLIGSGIEYQDRLVWADGEYLFSMEQLSHIINNSKALLTVKRNGNIFLSRQPRVLMTDLLLPSHVRNEIIDWQFEMPLKEKQRQFYMLPYVINSDGFVESPLSFIDDRDRKEAFPANAFLQELNVPLQAGDRILAVDGIVAKKGYQILELLQQHRVMIIVEKGVPADAKISWKEEDQAFESTVNYPAIETISQTIGTSEPLTAWKDFALLKPVEPKRIDQFFLTAEAQAQLHEEFERQKNAIANIRDPQKRAEALRVLEQSQNKYLLGIQLQDRKVDYNPTPLAMFGSVFIETWQTLKALVTGYLNPKWISGPVGIVQVLHHGWKVGIGEALFWIGAISLNLAVLNLLPIPVLDGGYVCLSLWEIITRRRVKAKTMERLIIPFVVLLVGLIIFLTFQDITRLFS
jgi:regulator of sigma E protease